MATQISVGSLAGANTAFTHRNSTFSVAQRGGVTDHGTLIANTTFRQDFSTSNMFKMTLGGNIVINNPTNQVAGQAGVITITNGGSHTVSWGADWDFAAGTAPVITVSGTDVLIILCYFCKQCSSGCASSCILIVKNSKENK